MSPLGNESTPSGAVPSSGAPGSDPSLPLAPSPSGTPAPSLDGGPAGASVDGLEPQALVSHASVAARVILPNRELSKWSMIF
jgi:hypothetical protein